MNGAARKSSLVVTVFSDAPLMDPGAKRTVAVTYASTAPMRKTIEIDTIREGVRASGLSFRAGVEVDALRRAIEIARSKQETGPVVVATLQCGVVRVEVAAGHNGVEGAVALTQIKSDGFRVRPVVLARRELAGLEQAVAAMKGATL